MDEGQRGIDFAFERLLPDRVEVSSDRSGPSAEQQRRNESPSGPRRGHRSASDPVSGETVPARAGPCATPQASEPIGQVPHLDVIDRLAADNGKEIIPLPFALRVLVAAAVNPIVGPPACIILPDVEGIAELVAAIAALVTLREDWPRLKEAFIEEVLQPGLGVRSLREGKVITFCGIADTFRTPPSIFSRAPHISVRRNELLSPTPVGISRIRLSDWLRPDYRRAGDIAPSWSLATGRACRSWSALRRKDLNGVDLECCRPVRLKAQRPQVEGPRRCRRLQWA